MTTGTSVKTTQVNYCGTKCLAEHYLQEEIKYILLLQNCPFLTLPAAAHQARVTIVTAELWNKSPPPSEKAACAHRNAAFIFRGVIVEPYKTLNFKS